MHSQGKLASNLNRFLSDIDPEVSASKRADELASIIDSHIKYIIRRTTGRVRITPRYINGRYTFGAIRAQDLETRHLD